MIPIIVLSTVTGTANFAQSSLPPAIASAAPAVIGMLNLIAALMTTVYQFLKISELLEANRQASINFGKLSRNITVELNLPVKNRSSGGAEFVKTCRSELDRLIEQSPYIEVDILKQYLIQFGDREDIAQPEILNIKSVDIYKDTDHILANTLAESAVKFKNFIKPKLKNFIPTGVSLEDKRKEDISKELETLSRSKLVEKHPSKMVSSEDWVSSINLLKPKITETVFVDIEPPKVPIELTTDPIEEPRPAVPESRNSFVAEQVINEIVDTIVKETTS